MTVRKLIDFSEILSPNRRLLGLDIGQKTVGLALSDISRTVATPMKTLALKKNTGLFKQTRASFFFF